MITKNYVNCSKRSRDNRYWLACLISIILLSGGCVETRSSAKKILLFSSEKKSAVGEKHTLHAAIDQHFGDKVSVEIVYAGDKIETLDALAKIETARASNLILCTDALAAQSMISAALTMTTPVPILYTVHVDPIAWGLSESLAQPGRLATGVTRAVHIAPKAIEALRTAFPNTKKIGVIFDEWGLDELATFVSAADQIGLAIDAIRVVDEADLIRKVKAARSRNVDALIVPANAVTWTHRQTLVDTINKMQIPAVYEGSVFALAGGLLVLEIDNAVTMRILMTYVDAVLGGTSISQLPVARPTRFATKLNINTALKYKMQVNKVALLQFETITLSPKLKQ